LYDQRLLQVFDNHGTNLTFSNVFCALFSLAGVLCIGFLVDSSVPNGLEITLGGSMLFTMVLIAISLGDIVLLLLEINKQKTTTKD